MKESNDVILSICIPTFNHENYIAKALDSVLMQKTKYKFEVLVGEDKSTDGTKEILKEYEKKYPGFFTMFYREQNMHKMEIKNAADLRRRCKGKYVIYLEGDDFWIDEEKLEKQICFLETHPEYYAVAHGCTVVGEDSQPIDEAYPSCTDENYTFAHYFSEIMPGQLTTLMYRDYYADENFDTSLLRKGLIPGDRLIYFALLCHGRVFCMQENMSAYRHITTHGSSFSASYVNTYSKTLNWYKELKAYAIRHASKKEVSRIELQIFNLILRSLFGKEISLKEAFLEYKNLKYKYRIFALEVKKIINKYILHKKLYLG